MRSTLFATVALSVIAAPAFAAPQVAVDILPVHSLVSKVMGDVGEPTLVVPPGASPHGYAMRPSEARAMQDADVIFWIGEELNPAFARSIESLAANAKSVALLDVPNVVRLEFREGATFEGHDHGNEGHGNDEAAADDDHGHEDVAAHNDDHGHDHEDVAAHNDDHGHDHEDVAAHREDHDHDHEDVAAHSDDHGHEEAAASDDHEHEEAVAQDDHGHGHDHDGVDPHAWLDPMNAKVWLDSIAATLSQADPENASTYFSNAAAAKDELDALIAEVSDQLAPVRDRNFVVFHDAYQYFEARFGVEAAGAIALSDAAQPSAARVAQVKSAIADMDAVCVFAEPQFEPRLIDTVIEGTDASKGVLDPLGAEIEPGPDFYPTLIKDLADDLVACLRPAS